MAPLGSDQPARKRSSAFPARLLAPLIAGLLSGPLHAQPEKVQAAEWRERIWSANRLYENEEGPGIRAFTLVGRYHGQYWAVDADQGRADGWENRRVIFGFNSRLSEPLSVEVQMHINDRFDAPVYDGLYVGFLEWAFESIDLAVSFGRLDYVFTGLERTTSSKEIYAVERGQLVNQVMPGEVFGLYGEGRQGRLSYQAGLFSGELGEEFTDFSGGAASLVGLGWDLPLLYEEGELHLDWLHNDGNPGNNAFEPYGNIVSLWHQGRRGRFALGVDLTSASGLEQRGDLLGLTVLPTWDLSENLLLDGDMLQLAFRYQYSTSSDGSGLSLQRRYEGEVATGNGDRYHAIYAGLNYLLYGNQLKLMAGGEYAKMRDSGAGLTTYGGWTWFGAVRLYF